LRTKERKEEKNKASFLGKRSPKLGEASHASPGEGTGEKGEMGLTKGLVVVGA